MAISPSINVLSLCSGVGGLDLAVRIAMPAARTVCMVEREIYAASLLATRMEQGTLDACPVWSDVTTFDGRPWRGVVDLITASLLCQPYSSAGKQLGNDDERAIWPEFIRVVGEVRPAAIFLENVPEFLRYFRPVGNRLQEMGYTVEEPLFLTAQEVGAPHRRERLFILAVANSGHDQRRSGDRPGIRSTESGEGPDSDAGGRDKDVAHREDWTKSNGARFDVSAGSQPLVGTELGTSSGDISRDHAARDNLAISSRGGFGELRESSGRDRQPDGSSGQLASGELGDTNRTRRTPAGTGRGLNAGQESQEGGGELGNPASDDQRRGRECSGRRQESARRSERDVALADSARSQGRDEEQARSNNGLAGRSGRSELPFFPPGPNDRDAWARILGRHPELAPAVEPGFRVLADGMETVLDEHRVGQLRAAGNGVVVLQAALAFALLIERAGTLKLAPEACSEESKCCVS